MTPPTGWDQNIKINTEVLYNRPESTLFKNTQHQLYSCLFVMKWGWRIQTPDIKQLNFI